MKIKKIFIAVAIIALCFYARLALAVQRVPFPDNSTMQPMPVNVKPNISGNVNYSGSRDSSPDISKNEQNENLPSKQSFDENQKKADKNAASLILGVLSTVLLILAAVIHKKKLEIDSSQ